MPKERSRTAVPAAAALLMSIVVAIGVEGGAPPAAECTRTCGGKHIPYPFGLAGDGSHCYLSSSFALDCDSSYNPPKLFTAPFDSLAAGGFEVADIMLSSGLMRVLAYISYDCYNSSFHAGVRITNVTFPDTFMLSYTQNAFTAVGCETETWLLVEASNWVGCMTGCKSTDGLTDGQCLGIGCCQTQIPAKARTFRTGFYTRKETGETYTFNNCSYSFPVEKNNYTFRKSHLTFMSPETKVPIILDWFVGDQSCRVAGRNRTGSACVSSNSDCVDSINGPGYICNCSRGYEGNPYVRDGCRDIDECKEPERYPCFGICVNNQGDYSCKCPEGSLANNPRMEKCIKMDSSSLSPGAKAAVGIGAGLGGVSFLFMVFTPLRRKTKKRRARKLQERYHQKNHALLEQLVSSHGSNIIRTRIFPLKEMEKATNKFDEARVVGCGGHGTVYKGLLMDNTVVAIKKSNKEEEEEVEAEIRQFTNEVAVLSQIDHRNVVRLIGCCLETEVPLLVYEFISNGTLFDHLHKRKCSSCLSWDDRLRIATEITSALSYMHSSASRSIFHRDLKTSNVLLDEKLTAKVSDFGTSRFIKTDQTHATTAIQGTYGYLDPEYYYTGMLTEKSDVFSMGVILLELLTGERAFPQGRSQEEGNLAACFLSAFGEDRVLQIIDALVIEEAQREVLDEVITLTERCLRLRGEERPTMKELEMTLLNLWKQQKH